MAVTPYYASLIRELSPADPIARMCVAAAVENDGGGLPADPFDELGHAVAPGLVRRYRDRAALWATAECAVRCRHCTRRNELGGGRRGGADLRAAVAWLRRHPEVREVLVTGGDPLTLSDRRLGEWLCALRKVPSVEILRLGTRVPVVLPMRVTPALCRLLRRYHPVWLNTHFNHPAELTPAARAACERLVDAGVPVGNQTVLLRGVNDSVATLAALFRELTRWRVRPYYLLQCDPVRGAGHFRVPLRRALAIAAGLRARLSGLAVPTLVVDVPGSRSKIALSPDRVERWMRGGAVLAVDGGRRVRVADPPRAD